MGSPCISGLLWDPRTLGWVQRCIILKCTRPYIFLTGVYLVVLCVHLLRMRACVCVRACVRACVRVC